MKTKANPKNLPNPSPAPDAEAPKPPISLSEIPGLGPIRVRALHKAGWTLRALHDATVEQLTSISGISAAKAQQILDYLAPHKDLPDTSLAVIPPPQAPSVDLRDAALRQTTLALCAVAEFSLNFASEEMRPRLQRELRQTAQQTAEMITAQLPLSDDQLTALTTCAQTLHSQITEALRYPKLGKKQQGDLSDTLATQNAKIQGLF